MEILFRTDISIKQFCKGTTVGLKGQSFKFISPQTSTKLSIENLSSVNFGKFWEMANCLGAYM